MNLHGEVIGAISVVNPVITATVRTSTGYTVDATGRQNPTYTTTTGNIQVQAFESRELQRLQHLHNLNIESVLRRIYAFGDFEGVVRSAAKGGDLITFNGAVWKVVQVFETWPGWCSVGVQQQVTP